MPIEHLGATAVDRILRTHTATPWRFEPEAEDDLAAIVGANRDEPPVMILDGAELEDDDLDFMLLAVNSYNDLLLTLRRAHVCATMHKDGTCGGCFVSESLARTEAIATTLIQYRNVLEGI